jgi:hypothetical protein
VVSFEDWRWKGGDLRFEILFWGLGARSAGEKKIGKF